MAAHLGGTRAGRGAIAGVLTGAVAVGAGQLVAGIIGAGSSPVVMVGQLQIDYTPPWLKNFAIREFGGHDKEILVGGILVVLAVFAAVLGMLAMRRLWYGLAGLAVFALVGVFAAATRPGAAAVGVLPALAAAAAGAVAMLALIRAATAAGPPEAHRGEETAGATARLPVPARPPARPVPSRPSASLVPPAGSAAAGPSAGPQPGRRHFLVVSGAVAGTAAAGGLAGRLLAERFSVTAARASLQLPGTAAPVPALPAGADLRIPPPPTGRSAAGTPRRRSRPNPGSTSLAAAAPSRPAALPSPGWPGRSTRASTRSRSGSTAAPGSRPGWPPSPASTPGGSGPGTGTPPPAGT